METIDAKTIVTRVQKTGWFGYEYNMNIYRGCCHGCIYCDSRSLCYGDDSFETVKVKADALRIIRDDLRRKAKKGVVGTGSMSDPYNPFEADLKLTRSALELINAFGFGVGIATKSPLAARDADVLADIKTHSPVIVKFTITTADDGLCKMLEPNTAPSSERFAALGEMAERGLCCGILLMPVLPYINDTKDNILEIVRLAKAHGARFIYPGFGVTMRDRQREYLYERLDALFPSVKEQYIKRYGNRYSCAVPGAKALHAGFNRACDEAGVLHDMRDIIRLYRQGYENIQLSLY